MGFPTFPLVMCSPIILATIKSIKRGRWAAKQRSQMCGPQKPCLQQVWEHVSATARPAQQGPSSACASQLRLPRGSQAPQQALQNVTCFCFPATNKPGINRNQNVNLKVQYVFIWVWVDVPAGSSAGSFTSWYSESMTMDSSIPTHLLAVAEVSKKRFVYEVWFISWREETAFFSGNGLVPIHCVTNPWYIRHHAKYSGLWPIAVDTLKVAASPAISCLKKSSIRPLLTSNGS